MWCPRYTQIYKHRQGKWLLVSDNACRLSVVYLFQVITQLVTSENHHLEIEMRWIGAFCTFFMYSKVHKTLLLMKVKNHFPKLVCASVRERACVSLHSTCQLSLQLSYCHQWTRSTAADSERDEWMWEAAKATWHSHFIWALMLR